MISRNVRVVAAVSFAAALLWSSTTTTPAAEWSQFRGPGATGRSPESRLPVAWGDSSGIVWKTPMPGPGSSSPIVMGGRIYVTCFTGYGTGGDSAGEMTRLKRHLLCINPSDGKILWNTESTAEMPEQDRIREGHGYASSTPAADATGIYVFQGRSGVAAFDSNGRERWRTRVGDRLNGWGSAASPVIHGNLVMVNASVESESVVALDKSSGKEVWRAGGIKESWHAPVIAKTPEGGDEIVVAMFRKIVALNPADGRELWHADTGINWYMCPTPVTEGGVVYSIGGRNPNGALAVRTGGRGDVTGSHVIWKLNKGSNVPSPVLHEGHLYFAHENLGIVYCIEAKTGRVVYEERLEPSPGQIYASPLLAGGRIYFIGRGGRAVVIAAAPVFKKLGEATLESNRGMFNASPAVVDNLMLIRSDRALYAIGGIGSN